MADSLDSNIRIGADAVGLGRYNSLVLCGLQFGRDVRSGGDLFWNRHHGLPVEANVGKGPSVVVSYHCTECTILYSAGHGFSWPFGSFRFINELPETGAKEGGIEVKVILIQDVKKLGSKGQIMEVSDGYGRNYLIPQGLAEEATKTRLKEIEEKGIKAEKKKNAEKEKAEIMKSKLHGQQVNIKVKTGSGDRLFGAVTPKEIAEVLQENFGVTIDKKKIEVGEPIKHVGNYTINIKIYPAVQAEVKLKVAPE